MLGYLPGFSDPTSYTERLLAGTGRLAFDVGANAGRVAAKLAERYGQVVAFEPCRESYDVLLLAAERHPNLEPVFAAVSDHSGTVTLSEAQVTERWGELVTGTSMPDWGPIGAGREVPSVTLDDCLLVYGAPDLVKVDTEGHEVHVLEGARETIADARPTWFIEIHAEGDGDAIDAMLPDYALEVVRHDGYTVGSPEYFRHFYLIAVPQ